MRVFGCLECFCDVFGRKPIYLIKSSGIPHPPAQCDQSFGHSFPEPFTILIETVTGSEIVFAEEIVEFLELF